MSEQHAPLPDDFRTWLTERGADAYALAWVETGSNPTGGADAEAPHAGETGIARTGADLTRLMVQEVTRGRQETLRRWLQLDDGTHQLAIIGTEFGGLREYTPGELTAQLMHAPDSDEAQITHLLAGWLYRRNAEAPQGLELGWIAAAAAWTWHMRAYTSYPTPSVLARSLESAGEQDEATEELVISTGLKMADLFDRLERTYRPRAELVEDWRAVESLTGDVPTLQQIADWLLDQIALRDAHAQQLRAVLEPDITDHLRDRRADGHLSGIAAPTLDEARTAHLAQARETVRAYTAAAHSGREQQAQQLLNAFPIPARSLQASGPATAWRRNSATAQDAVDALAAQRASCTAEESTDYFADPELLHAQTSYLAAREGQLHLIHDALGRLDPTPIPRDLPDELVEVASAQTQRRIIEAFGTTDRARQVLDGQISYLQQQPTPFHRRAQTSVELALLQAVRRTLDRQPIEETHDELDAGAIAQRVEQIMSAPQPESSWRPVSPQVRERRVQAQSPPMSQQPDIEETRPAAHDQAHTQALATGSATPGVQR